MAADSAANAGPRLSPQQVSALAAGAFKARSDSRVPGQRFEAQRPKFSDHDGVWYVFFRQKGPVLAIDGDMVVVVNDRTSKVCVGQMMAPPIPCS
jgi:hypothetical protein